MEIPDALKLTRLTRQRRQSDSVVSSKAVQMVTTAAAVAAVAAVMVVTWVQIEMEMMKTKAATVQLLVNNKHLKTASRDCSSERGG